jgi:magnesium transporter
MATTQKKRRKGWRGRIPSGFRPGEAPGTLAVDPDATPTSIRLFAYGPEGFLEKEGVPLEEAVGQLGKWPVVWINVDGLGDTGSIRSLGESFGLHRLAVEDVVNVGQRAKAEPYDDHVFLVAPMLSFEDRLQAEQLSLFVGNGWVLTFQERRGDRFDPVRERIRHGRGKIRTVGADYLAYALLDAVIDGGFPVAERISEILDGLEEEVLVDPDPSTVGKIQRIRNDLLGFRRAAWPLRDVVATLLRGDSAVFDRETLVYLRDCHDHTMRVLDLVETYREVASGLMDGYMSQMSHRMNEVMKVLTIIATIFIPLSFIAGVYGMNFDSEVSRWNMPELHWVWGYPFALGMMLAAALGMLWWFRKKGWF